MVGSRHMSMGAYYEAHLAIEKVPHRLLLARGFRVEVDDNGVGYRLERAGGDFTLQCCKRIVERIHEDAAHSVDDKYAGAVAGIDQCGAASRRSFRIVDRADEPWRAFDEDQSVLLIPGMIAERDRIRAGRNEVVINRLCDSKTAGGILAVDDDEIELPAQHHRRQTLRHGAAPATSDDVTDEKDAHVLKSCNQ